MKEKLRQFMIGRYGVDDLSRAQIIVSMVLLLVSTFLSAFLGKYFILAWPRIVNLFLFQNTLTECVKALRREPEIFKCEIPGSGKEKQSEKTLGTAQYLPFL